MKLLKRTLSWLLVCCLLACMLPATVFAAEAMASGTCGENLTWVLDDSGLLKISGTGEMNNYLDYHAEWYDYREQIVSIIIEEGVTSIGDYAFYDCDNLLSVKIPGSVLTIGQCAFLFCDNLASVTLSHGITVIKESAFGQCTGITSITLPDSVTSIEQQAFYGCTALTSVNLPQDLAQISDNSFECCSALTGISIPDGIVSIGYGAFRNCTSLTEITIPDSVTTICGEAFSGCSNLETVRIPETVTSFETGSAFKSCPKLTTAGPVGSGCSIEFGWTEEIPDYAFSECESLTSVTIPGGVSSIGDFAYTQCSSLATVDVSEGITYIGYRAFFKCINLTNFTIPDGVDTISTYAFQLSGLTEITIPKSVTFIDYGAFRECASLSKIVFEGDMPGYLFSVFMGVTATAYYPSNNSTWADVETLPHSGNITWVPYEVEESVVRIFGATRYDTAFKAADQLKVNLSIEKFQNIVVAYGEDFADALSGSYLANQKNAPILLVKNRNKEINLAKDYIKANLVSGGTVYLLGGVNAVPKAMESGLEGFNVKRLAGATRYETNLEILKEAGISGSDILVCTGLDFADGLSASAVNKPILLVKDSLRATQVNYLKTLGTKNFYLIGGTNAVNKRIESALTAYGTTQRIEGATRYYTSVNIAKTFFPNAKTAVLAYAQNFPDGLSGGCLACSMNAPLILTANGKQAPAVAYAKEAGITGGAVLGGTGLIPDRVANAIFQIS